FRAISRVPERNRAISRGRRCPLCDGWHGDWWIIKDVLDDDILLAFPQDTVARSREPSLRYGQPVCTLCDRGHEFLWSHHGHADGHSIAKDHGRPHGSWGVIPSAFIPRAWPRHYGGDDRDPCGHGAGRRDRLHGCDRAGGRAAQE